MISREVYPEEKKLYNSHARHPVQTWEWGEFQKSQGHHIYRLADFDGDKMKSSYTVSFHRIPKTPYSVGTMLRGPQPSSEMISSLQKIGHQENALFIKLEPDVIQKTYSSTDQSVTLPINMDFPKLVVSPKIAFYPFSYVVDLTKTEDELLSLMHSKTRYNIKVANRHGVKVQEMTNDEGFEIYLKLLFETTKRQGFYLHSRQYHRDLWKILKPTKTVHIMIASYNDYALAAFMLFTCHDRLFYPYGASTEVHREVMAPTLLMWECVKLGQSLGLKSFDMWGSLGPDAKETDIGYGFHRFKQGFGGQLVQFVGTYDLVINPPLYQIYNQVDKYRWTLLRLFANVRQKITVK